MDGANFKTIVLNEDDATSRRGPKKDLVPPSVTQCLGADLLPGDHEYEDGLAAHFEDSGADDTAPPVGYAETEIYRTSFSSKREAAARPSRIPEPCEPVGEAAHVANRTEVFQPGEVTPRAPEVQESESPQPESPQPEAQVPEVVVAAPASRDAEISLPTFEPLAPVEADEPDADEPVEEAPKRAQPSRREIVGMRAVANRHAKQEATRHLLGQATSQFWVAAVAVIASFLLIQVSAWARPVPTWVICVVLTAAIIFSGNFLLLAGQILTGTERA